MQKASRVAFYLREAFGPGLGIRIVELRDFRLKNREIRDFLTIFGVFMIEYLAPANETLGGCGASRAPSPRKVWVGTCG